MNKTTKWILGILAGIILLAVIACAAVFFMTWLGGDGWVMGTRSGRLWENRGIMPWQSMHGTWRGLFLGPIGMLAPALLCLGVIVLIIVGVVALVLNQQKKGAQPSPVAPTSTAAAVPAPPSVEVNPPSAEVQKTCSTCNHSLSQEWKVCPYCGTPVDTASE